MKHLALELFESGTQYRKMPRQAGRTKSFIRGGIAQICHFIISITLESLASTRGCLSRPGNRQHFRCHQDQSHQSLDLEHPLPPEDGFQEFERSSRTGLYVLPQKFGY